ncbi:hypothetical protein ACAG25_16135 [Mycobacterium sp. pV006]|uniref:hypothetical protein n=1 Tax=Mycobacterium sp. pV006 TaxID=3238983 RepID=UPI00351B5733
MSASSASDWAPSSPGPVESPEPAPDNEPDPAAGEPRFFAGDGVCRLSEEPAGPAEPVVPVVSASAAGMNAVTAAPTPNATASAPTRPTYLDEALGFVMACLGEYFADECFDMAYFGFCAAFITKCPRP